MSTNERRTMIVFRSEGTQVVADVDTRTHGDKPRWHFKFDTGYHASADVMARHLNEELQTLVIAARRAAYERGYRHGRNHTAKDKHFFCLLRGRDGL